MKYYAKFIFALVDELILAASRKLKVDVPLFQKYKFELRCRSRISNDTSTVKEWNLRYANRLVAPVNTLYVDAITFK